MGHGRPIKERVCGETMRHAEERARQKRYVADVAACETWNFRMQRKRYRCVGCGLTDRPQVADSRWRGFSSVI
jgi:hypothetical protein